MDYSTILLKYAKKLIYPFLLVLFLILSGVSVQYIPAEPTDTNIKKACKIFDKEWYYPIFNGRITDNYTDAVSLLISQSQPREESYKRFFVAPIYSILKVRTIVDQLAPLESLCGKRRALYVVAYSRYWHGYQSILRPLLYFTDYQHIRLINTYLQPLLFALIIFLFWINKLYGLILGWIVGYIILNPEAMAMNISYSIIYYVTSVCTILMLIFKDLIQKYISWPIFFMMIGICTNYFDWLTYPVYSLVIPLVVLFYMNPAKSFDEMWKSFALLVACWGMGYVGMWILRWILSTLLTDKNVLADALSAIVHRGKSQVSKQGYPFGFAVYATYVEMTALYDEAAVIYLAFFVSAMAVLCTYHRSFLFLEKYYFLLLPFLGGALLVPLYCLMIKGHPIQHAPYVYRIWAAFFFALISGLNFWVLKVWEEKKKESKND